MGKRLAIAALALSAAACGSSGSPSGGTSQDASSPDGASPIGDGGVAADVIFRCEPADVSQFTAPAYKPAKSMAGACTQRQLDDFFTACLGEQATGDTCNTFANTAANATCVGCLVSNDLEDTRGPVVDNGRFVSLNVDGCMELTDGVAGKACAAADQAANACEDQACRANCPINRGDDPAQRNAELAAYDACTVQADRGGCKPFADAASCLDGERDGGLAAACFRGQTFQDLYNAIAPIFCMSPPPRGDGG